jgi:predicted TPR repeat methyltransferase
MARPMRFTTMLDLGCGTGLVGEAFRPYVDNLVGVDISSGMIAQARSKRLYDRLETQEIVDGLMTDIRADRRYDLVTAAEVFNYFPDLSAVMNGVAGILAPSGMFAFTCETHDGDGTVLRETSRFAQGDSYVLAVLADAGLIPVAIESMWIRMQRGAPVPALVVVAANATA